MTTFAKTSWNSMDRYREWVKLHEHVMRCMGSILPQTQLDFSFRILSWKAVRQYPERNVWFEVIIKKVPRRGWLYCSWMDHVDSTCGDSYIVLFPGPQSRFSILEVLGMGLKLMHRTIMVHMYFYLGACVPESDWSSSILCLSRKSFLLASLLLLSWAWHTISCLSVTFLTRTSLTSGNTRLFLSFCTASSENLFTVGSLVPRPPKNEATL